MFTNTFCVSDNFDFMQAYLDMTRIILIVIACEFGMDKVGASWSCRARQVQIRCEESSMICHLQIAVKGLSNAH